MFTEHLPIFIVLLHTPKPQLRSAEISLMLEGGGIQVCGGGGHSNVRQCFLPGNLTPTYLIMLITY